MDRVAIVPLESFTEAKARASNFCKERNWEKFHKPPSIALALTGKIKALLEFISSLEPLLLHFL